ncbi:MAG: ribonuclease H-like domain-containing protein [Planctomycetota bacterium]
MSESFAERMRRLRREAPKPLAPEAVKPQADEAEKAQAAPVQASVERPRREGPPVWLQARLRAKERRRADTDGPIGGASGLPKGPPGDPARLADLSDGGAERISDWSLAEPHGESRLERALEAPNEVLVRVAKDPALESLDPGNAVYFDIETTGLSGGAGTYPYLIALARFRGADEGGGFEVWQGFMRSPADEPGMLRAAAERIAAASGVVTFFGKSFDRHRVEDKLRQHGIASPFDARPHLDLYHPCKRLYGGAYVDGKLQTMERELLGFTREHDLSGAYAPEAWFDYVAGRPHRLEEVFRHNLLDVVSLAALTGHLGAAYDERFANGGALRGSALHRARGWAKLHGDAREREREREWLERAAERTAALGDFATLARRQMQFDRARSFAKDRQWSAAWEQLEALLAEPDEDGVRAQALAESARLGKRCGATAELATERARSALELARRTLSGRARAQVEKSAGAQLP